MSLLLTTYRYEGACPTVRYIAADGYYYVMNLHSESGGYGKFSHHALASLRSAVYGVRGAAHFVL